MEEDGVDVDVDVDANKPFAETFQDVSWQLQIYHCPHPKGTVSFTRFIRESQGFPILGDGALENCQ
jgi:hypothetical protein